MGKPRFIWDDNKIEILKNMLSNKTTYKDIAYYFNTTKSVINGAVTRYGLAGQYYNALHKVGDENENWEIINTYVNDKGRRMVSCVCKCGCGEIYDVRNDKFNEIKKICKKQKEYIKAEKDKEHADRDSYKTRLIGKKFGNLIVTDFAGYNKYKEILYKCECQCDDKTILNVTYNKLVSGKKDNCGCLTSKKQSEAHNKQNEYDLTGEYGIGWASNTNKEFYFDLEDYDKIKDYCWIEHNNYLCANSKNNGKHYIRMHRIIMGVTDPKIKVDHIFHNTFDNRKAMLRIATNQENTRNHYLHSNNTSGVSGVGFEKDTGLWRARIFVNGKGIHLGRFVEFDNAVRARLQAEVQYFGEFLSQPELFKEYGVTIPYKYEVVV